MFAAESTEGMYDFVNFKGIGCSKILSAFLRLKAWTTRFV